MFLIILSLFFYFSLYRIASYFQLRLFSIFYLLNSMNMHPKPTKNQYFPISILELPSRSAMVEVSPHAEQCKMYFLAEKKVHLEAYNLFIPNAKLFNNLEVYEWRRQTQFPISKTQYVQVKKNTTNQPHIVELKVYIQHCLSRLSSMQGLKLNQLLYLLKESTLGFERLFNRFGAFEINQNMISINQKGFCRAWINENFSSNLVGKKQLSEEKMVEQIKHIFQKRCSELKSGKKLFIKLKDCKKFFDLLKDIDSFISENRIIVASRIKFLQQEDNYRSQNISPFRHIDFDGRGVKNSRNSVVAEKTKKYSIYYQQVKSMEKNFRDFEHQVEIKKIKSSENINLPSLKPPMKKSGDKMKGLNAQDVKFYQTTEKKNSPRLGSSQKFLKRADFKDKQWLQDSCFTMDNEQKKEKRNKNDLSISEGILTNPQKSWHNSNNKSFSTNFTHKKQAQLSKSKVRNGNKKSHQNSYTEEFNMILNESSLPHSPKNRKNRNDREENSIEKLRQSHTETVIKNNGWKSFTGFLEEAKELNQSFQQGQEENAYIREIKLDKLESLGRRGPAMSILPEEYQDIF